MSQLNSTLTGAQRGALEVIMQRAEYWCKALLYVGINSKLKQDLMNDLQTIMGQCDIICHLSENEDVEAD